ncbi:3405_t:CDS:2 [Entrophospora sp. SA101]|nr:7752_t:CDS:2 [Entrophospora sp. SA101]CAJ0896441.1 3405_t:CDS:2 [Entrophospora sp. SA101]
MNKFKEPLKVFSLPEEMLQDITFKNTSINLKSEKILHDNCDINKEVQEQLSNTSITTINTATAKSFSCLVCGITDFEDGEQQRTHFKLDWHRYNVKRHVKYLEAGKFKNYQPISEQNFEEIMNDSMSSISGSDTELEDEEEIDEDNGAITLKPQKQQSQHKEPRYWTMIMLMGGHFAGSILDINSIHNTNFSKSIKVHKTFHRYTTRRKQGGSQSSNDNSKGKAKSAGADLRRYNEMALSKEIRELIEEWRLMIDQSELIFMHAPGRNKKIIYGYENAVLKKDDPRISTFPFSTRRPTFKELERSFNELITVKIFELSLTTEEGDEDDKNKEDDLLKDKSSQERKEDFVEYLLKQGANPTQTSKIKNMTAYEIAKDKETRNVFRRFMADEPDKYDWKLARVPSYKVGTKATTTESSSSEVYLIGLTPEERLNIEREKRARAAEERLLKLSNRGVTTNINNNNICKMCRKSLSGLIPFDKFNLKFCSTQCVRDFNK